MVRLLGNLLAILSGVADPLKAATILDFIDRHGMAQVPLRSLTPVIKPGHPDWRDYYGTLNQPHLLSQWRNLAIYRRILYRRAGKSRSPR